MRNIVATLILTASSFVYASSSGWDVTIHEDWATLYDTHRGELSLTEAVNSLPKELHEFLSSNYPELHAEALSSAGNMRNPKVTALREPINQAILASSLAKEIGIILTSRCERIASTSYEKFMIRKKDGHPIYSAMVWLSTEKCT